MTNDGAQTEGAVPPRRPFVSRKVSPALFCAILIAFALPFGTVSCEGPPVQFTGYELATWRVPQTIPPATTDDGESLPGRVEREASGIAFVMLAAALAGLGLGLAGRRGAGLATSAGLVGTTVLWLRILDINSGAEPRNGFVLATVLFLILAFWHGFVAIRRARSGPRGARMLLPPGAVPLGRLEPWKEP